LASKKELRQRKEGEDEEQNQAEKEAMTKKQNETIITLL